MSPPQKRTPQQVFRQLDENGDGMISKAEYTKALLLLDIPLPMAKVVTESVFAKFDANKDGRIDENEFLTYFSEDGNNDNLQLHQRMDRALYERSYSFFWAMYFVVVGFKLFFNPLNNVDETFPGIASNDAAAYRHAVAHMFAILGLSFMVNGISVLLQRVVKVSTVATLGMAAAFWFGLTIYEHTVGSIVNAPGFKEPPVMVPVLSGALCLGGLWGLCTGKVKVKQD